MGKYWRSISRTALPAMLSLLVFMPWRANAQMCAEVKLEIAQEATLEREAFDAKLTLSNNYTDTPLENLEVAITFKDSSGIDAADKFYIKLSSTQGVAFDANDKGVIGVTSKGILNWLIIPSTGAGGTAITGQKYSVSAKITYTIGGVSKLLSTFSDTITVKPQPLIKLEYMLPFEVFSDEPLTTTVVEPVEPFALGVRVTNVGYGTASNFKINSGQPEIEKNAQGADVKFTLLGAYVGDKAIANTFLVPFGSIAPNAVSQASWIMSTTLSGKFKGFNASFTHAAELGGQLTSLIQDVTTYTLIKDVLVDVSGRDTHFDFLVNTTTTRSQISAWLENGVEPLPDVILESDQSSPIAVVNSTADVSGVLSGTNSSLVMTVQGVSSNIWLHAWAPLQWERKIALKSAKRKDGTELNTHNYWISKHFDGKKYVYWLHILDLTSADNEYTITFDPNALDQAPGAVVTLNVQASTAPEGLQLNWSAPGEDNYTGDILGGRYLFQFNTTESAQFAAENAQVSLATATSPGNLESYIVSDLIGNTTYYVKMWTQDTGGTISEISNSATVYSLPRPPTGLELVNVSSHSAAVTWKIANNAMPIAYVLTASTGVAVDGAITSPMYDSFTTTHTFNSLAANTTYFFYGVALSTDTGVSSEQSYMGSTITLAAEPGAIAYSQLFVSSFTVAWNAGGNPVETEYFVEISTTEDWTFVAWESGWQATPQYTLAGLVAGTTYYARVKARNASGVETAYSNLGTIRTLLVDVLPPVTALAFTGASYGAEPVYVSSTTGIGLKAADALREAGDNLGVAATTYYAVDSDTFSVYAGTFSLVTAGWHQVKYYSNDNVGNTEAVRISSIAVDDMAPAPALAVSSPVYISSGVVYVSSLSTVMLHAVDEYAGVKELAYTLDGSTYSVAAAAQAFALAEGTHTISYSASDNLGNNSEVLFSSIAVDNLAPESAFAVTGSSVIIDEKLYLAGGSSVTLKAIDGGAGVLELHYTLDGSTGIAASGWEFMPGAGEHTLEFYAADNLGNTENARNQVFFVDSTAPVTSAVFEGTPGLNGWYVAPVAITLASTDTLSGVKEIFYALDGSTTAAVYVSSFGITAEGAHTLAAYAADNAGNAEAPVDYTIKIDTTAPVVAYSIDRSSSAAGWYNKPVDVVFAGTDAVSGVAYCSSSFTLETEGLAVPATGYCDDYAGLSSTVSFTVNIDTTAPIVVSTRTPANGNGWNNSHVTVGFECTDVLSGPAGCPAAITLTEEGLNISTAARAFDAAGNYADLAVEGINIDTAAPVSTAALSGIYGAGVYNSAVTMRLDVTDALAGVQDAYYAVDGGTATLYTEPVQVVAVGTHTISHYAVDKASNTELARTISFEIQKPAVEDTLPPVTWLTLLAPNYGATPTYISSLTPVALNAYDDMAAEGDKIGELAATYYAIDSDTFTVYAGTFSVAGEGEHILKYYSVDAAGHTEEAKTLAVIVDNTAPAAQFSVEGSTQLINGDLYLANGAHVTIEATDTGVGLKTIHYTLDGTTQTALSPIYLWPEAGKHVLEFYAEDKLENRNSPETHVYTLDTETPFTTAVASGIAGSNDWYISAVTVTLASTDTLSGVVKVNYSLDDAPYTVYNSSFTVSKEGEHSVRYYAVDAFNNEESAKELKFKIDLAAPIITTASAPAPNAAGWNNSEVYALFNGEDAASGVAYCTPQYAVPGEGAGLPVTGYCVDYAGLSSTATFRLNLDITRPVSTATLSGIYAEGVYNSAVTVTVGSTDTFSGVGELYYSLNYAAFAPYIAPVSVAAAGEHSFRYYAVDKAGNNEPENAIAFTIQKPAGDSLPPSTSLLFSTPSYGAYVSSVTAFVLNAYDDMAVAGDRIGEVAGTYYSIDSDTFTLYSGAFSIMESGVHVLKYYSLDTFGHEEIAKTENINVDSLSPVTAPVLEGMTGLNGWHVSAVGVTVVSTDAQSGVKDIFYALDGSTAVYASSFSVTAEGAHTLAVYATDNIGNVGTPVDYNFKIDITSPVAAAWAGGFEVSAGSNPVITTATPVALTAADGIAGVSAIYYTLDTQFAMSAAQTYNGALTLSEGNHVLNFTVSDNAGNMAEVRSIMFNVGSNQSGPGAISGTIYTPGMNAGDTVTVLVSTDYFRNNMQTFSFATQGGSFSYTISLPAGAYAIGAMGNTSAGTLIGIHADYALVQVNAGSPAEGIDLAIALDNQAPTAAVTSITDGQSINSLGAIAGTAADNIGAERIFAAVQDTTAGTWWNPDSGQWVTTNVDSVLKDARANITGAPSSLQWALGGNDSNGALYNLPAHLENGKTYRLYIKASDLTGNKQAQFTIKPFTWGSGQSAAMGTISGTIYTPDMNAGDTVMVMVSSGNFRNDVMQTFSFVTQGSSLSYTVSLPPGNYAVGALANTNAGTIMGIYENYSLINVNAGSSADGIDFALARDTQAPASAVTSINSGDTITSLTAISGTAADNIGVENMFAAVEDVDSGTWWEANASKWTTGVADTILKNARAEITGVPSALHWTLSTRDNDGALYGLPGHLQNGRRYRLYTKACDLSGNMQEGFTVTQFIWSTGQNNGTGIISGTIHAPGLSDGTVITVLASMDYFRNNVTQLTAEVQGGIAAYSISVAANNTYSMGAISGSGPGAYIGIYNNYARISVSSGNAVTGIDFGLASDTEAPTSAVTSISNGARISSLGGISGTASDNVGGIGFEAAVEDIANGKFWNANSGTWISTDINSALAEARNSAVGLPDSVVWTTREAPSDGALANIAAQLVAGNEYRLYVRVYDFVGNKQPSITPVSFIWAGQGTAVGTINGTIYTPDMNAGDTVMVMVSSGNFRNDLVQTFSFVTQGSSLSYTVSLPPGNYAVGALVNTNAGTIMGIYGNYSLINVNAGSSADGIDFALARDTQAPASAVTSINSGDTITSLAAISGTAADNIGVENMFAAVEDVDSGTWWEANASKWTTGVADTVLKNARAEITGAPSALHWTLSTRDNDGALYGLPGNLQDGRRYRLYIKARDLSGNMQEGFTTTSFIWSSGQSAATGMISGTISTPGMSAGDTVTVLVSTDYFRNATRTFSFVTQGSGFSYNLSVPVGAYVVGAMANSGNGTLLGIYGNYSQVQVGNGTSFNGADFGLALDGQAPASAIAAIPNGNTINTLAVISGMASDNVGVERIYAAVQDVAAGTWWNHDSMQWMSGDAGSVLKDARAHITGVPSSLQWALALNDSNGALYNLSAHLEKGKTYRLYIKARDLSGNMQADFTTAAFTWSDYQGGGSNAYGVISGTISVPGLSDGAVITVLASNSYFRYDVAQASAIVHGGIAAYSISVDTSTVYSIGAISGSGAGTYIGIYNNYARLSVNAGAVLTGINFGMAIDGEEPTSAITSLYNGEVVDSLNGISGTAADNVGVAEMQLAVEDAGTGLWWNAANGQWVSTDAASAFVSGNISMQQLPNAVSWGIQDSRSTGVFSKLTSYSGNAYRLYIRAKDFAGNVQKTYAPVWFVLHHGENTNTGRISGTISAPGLNDGTAVRLLASRGFFRDDITQSSATVQGGSLAYSISVAVPGLYAIGAISETGSYVGIYNNYTKVNISSAADIGGINFSMARDTEAPTAAITAVSGGAYLNALGSIYGTAADNVGGSVLEAAVQDLATGLFWYQQNAVWATAANGSEFSAAISSTSETRRAFNWRLPMYASDGALRGAAAELKIGNTYRLYVRMRDFAGNVQQAASAVSFTWGAEPVNSATISGAIYAPELADGTAVTVSAFNDYFNHAMAKGNFVVQGGVAQYSLPVVAPSSCFIAALSGSGSYVGSYNNYERLSVSTGANITGMNFNMAVDNAAPVSAISSISDGMPVTSLSAISGTAADNIWVYNMLAALQDVNSGLWWSAADSSWTAAAYAFDTAGVDMWGLPGAAAWTLRDEDSSGAFTGLTSKLRAGKKYRLYLKARDYAGNVEQSYNSVTFRWHSDISPSSGPIGIPFTITGEKFGTYAAGITTVLIGGATAPLTQWSATAIKGTLPGTLPAGEQTVVIMRGTTTITDVAPFTVTVPTASAVTPSSGSIGLPFTITGESFGNYVANYTRVLIGGATAPLTLWTDGKIQGTVPGSLASGEYELVVERELNGGKVSSAPITFKVVTPELDAIVPTYGAIGIGFTLTGANFGNYVANYTRVLIGGATAPLTLWQDGKIQGTVPGTLLSGTYEVAVERELNGGLVRSATVAFSLVLPEAQSVTPSSGAIGLPFTITGTHFGNYVANFTRVLIGGTTTPVTLWTDTKIQGTVPGGLTAGKYELVVERELNGGRAASLPLAFEVLGVNVSSITPASGPIGLPFTIYGSNFGNYSAGYTKVLMGGTTMPITLWTDVKIQGTVPGSLTDGDYPVVVERNLNGGQVQSSSLTFTVASPAVYTLSPSSGPIGLPFTLTGLNFGNYLAGYTKVLIGGVAAPVTLWTDVKVQGTIPGALAPGDYALYVERAANGGVMRSSTATFTVGAPYLASVSPATAAVQAVYTLAGYNFGNYSAGYTKVRVNGSTTAVTLWNDGKIQGKLPSLPAGTYPVQVQLVLNGGLGESATSYITVVEPVISSMTPVSGQARATVNLYGSGFGAYDASLTRLLMDGTTCTVSLWNDARITASVPAALAYGTHTVVAARGAAYSNGVDFLLTSAYTASMFKAVTTSVEFALGEVYVYPNPAKGGAVPIFHIECGTADSVKIEVYTISGQAVHEYTITGAPQLITDSSGASYAYEYAWRGHIASGVYLYRIEASMSGRKLKKTGKFAVVR